MSPTILHLLLIFSGSPATSPTSDTTHVIEVNKVETEGELYGQINWGTQHPEFDVFYAAVKGYNLLQDSLNLFNRPLVTIIDFSRSSSQVRLWVVNLETKEVIIQTLVAHGRNSGEILPTRFSNEMNSFQSSLGFYRTGIAYIGKHGLSLKLHGIEREINDQAEQRAIVIHGADYVSEKYIARNGRLGRSQGCPAVTMAIHKELIKTIQDKTCLFVYYPERDYFEKSAIFRRESRDTQVVHEFTTHDLVSSGENCAMCAQPGRGVTYNTLTRLRAPSGLDD